MGNFKESLEGILAAKRSQERAKEEAVKQNEVEQADLQKEWFNIVDLLEKRAIESVFPPLQAVGEKIDGHHPYIDNLPTPYEIHGETRYYRKTRRGIERFLGTDRTLAEKWSLPYVTAILFITTGYESGSDQGWNTKDYYPGSGIKVVCVQQARGILARVTGYKGDREFLQGETNITDRHRIEKLILAVFKEIY